MIFDVELISLLLYCAQQLGVALGLGAQTIMLVAYLSSIHDGVIDATEERLLRATRNTLWVSLALMVISGVAITALHFLGGQGVTVLTPAYLFKTILIVLVIVLTALLHTLPETFAEGLLGGTWYALFLVHILAPVTTWVNLLTLWAVWMVGFNLIWYVLVFSTRERKKFAAKPVPFKGKVREKEKEKEIPRPAPLPIPTLPKPEPQQFQPITLDPVPLTPPIAVESKFIPPPPAPVSHVRPVILSVEKLPAGLTTDTPFLPQVPPLQAIPTIPPATSTVPATNSNAPVIAAAAPISPELKAGLNVMPKSPDQMQQ
jgi:hypothetical protein